MKPFIHCNSILILKSISIVVLTLKKNFYSSCKNNKYFIPLNTDRNIYAKILLLSRKSEEHFHDNLKSNQQIVFTKQTRHFCHLSETETKKILEF